MDEKVIKCRNVLRNKLGSDRNIERRKAQVVAKGFAQQPGIHFFETFAPVARLGSLRLLIALAAKLNLKISQLDVETGSVVDPCVYVDKNSKTFIVVYVDDILIFSNDRARERKVKQRLSEEFKLKDVGEARYCLGLEIQRDKKSIILSQSGYIVETLKRFGMSDCKPVNTPLAA